MTAGDTLTDIESLTFISSDNSVSITGDDVNKTLDLTVGTASKYQQNFVVGDWVGPTMGEYTLTIAQATHLKGINPHIAVFENVSGQFEKVYVSTTVSNTGTITLAVLESPDLRFAGKLTII